MWPRSVVLNLSHIMIVFNLQLPMSPSPSQLTNRQRKKAPLTNSDSGNLEDNYVPMNPGSSPIGAALGDSPQNNYIPMSPGPHHFDFPGFSATLPARRGSSASLCHRPNRLSDVTPPPINRNLKPDRKCESPSPWRQGEGERKEETQRARGAKGRYVEREQ